MGWRRRGRAEQGSPGREETVLDLRDPVPDAPRHVWGSPARCPACGEHGYIDRIDLVREVMFQHCPSCWTRYEIARAETDAR